MRHPVPPVALLVVASTVAGCVDAAAQSTLPVTPVESNGERYTLTLASESAPIHRGVNDITLRVRTANNSAGSVVTLRAWMPAHGHETYPVSIIEDSPGVFTARGLTITMPGEWIFDVGLAPTDNAGVDDRATLWASVE